MHRESCFLTATEMISARRSRRLSNTKLMQSCLSRAQERNAQLHAWPYLDMDGALATAQGIDRESTDAGALQGIPVGIKDIIDVAHMPTRYLSPIYAQNVAQYDAACVASIKHAGGIIAGKTATTELANRRPSEARNPHHPSHTPGGSSSGSAIAVADFHVPIALGTQTSGSTIRPAAYCGVIGYVPGGQIFASQGIKALSHSTDTLGIFARSVQDIALMRSVLLESPWRMPDAPSGTLRLGLCLPVGAERAQQQALTRLAEVSEALNSSGRIRCEPFTLAPSLFEDWETTQRQIVSAETARNLAYERHAHRDRLSKEILDGHIGLGEAVTPDEYLAARASTDLMCNGFDQDILEYDALLTLPACGEAPEGLQDTGSAVFDALWTLLRLPAITLPTGVGTLGLPLGIQLVGKRYRDDSLLAIAEIVASILKETSSVN